MKIKRYHPTLKAAREYCAALPTGHGLRIYPIKKRNKETGRMNTVRFWVGTEFEWLNRY